MPTPPRPPWSVSLFLPTGGAVIFILAVLAIPVAMVIVGELYYSGAEVHMNPGTKVICQFRLIHRGQGSQGLLNSFQILAVVPPRGVLPPSILAQFSLMCSLECIRPFDVVVFSILPPSLLWAMGETLYWCSDQNLDITLLYQFPNIGVQMFPCSGTESGP